MDKTPNLWRKPFDVKDPIHTPRELNTNDAAVRAAVMQALAGATKKLNDAHVPLDAPWGSVQYTEVNGEKIGIPGGLGNVGMFSVMQAKFTPEKGYTPIVTGNSWMQVVTWDAQGALDARGLLAYSQSQEADSPHAADQTRLYAKGEWLKLPFTETRDCARSAVADDAADGKLGLANSDPGRPRRRQLDARSSCSKAAASASSTSAKL